MSVGFSSKPNSCMHATISYFLLPFSAIQYRVSSLTLRTTTRLMKLSILNDYGSNKSSASYLVPLAGSKAIMISWGTYDDYSS
ncbi:hypothetical protein MTO96_021699 [Rhipicephalus appendiculatus]